MGFFFNRSAEMNDPLNDPRPTPPQKIESKKIAPTILNLVKLGYSLFLKLFSNACTYLLHCMLLIVIAPLCTLIKAYQKVERSIQQSEEFTGNA